MLLLFIGLDSFVPHGKLTTDCTFALLKAGEIERIRRSRKNFYSHIVARAVLTLWTEPVPDNNNTSST